MYFATDVQKAINMVSSIFDNTGNPSELPIEVRPTTNIVHVHVGYDPSAQSTFIFVYGKGD